MLDRTIASAVVAAATGALAVLALQPADATQRPARAAAPGLCRAGETMIFQCRVRREFAAICGGEQGGRRYAQYRFGTPGRIALTYPRGAAEGSGSLNFARIPFSGGGELQFNFTNGGYDYLLYSRTIRTGFAPGGTNNPRQEDGVLVRRNGRMVSNRACTDSSEGVGDIEAFVPRGDYVEHD